MNFFKKATTYRKGALRWKPRLPPAEEEGRNGRLRGWGWSCKVLLVASGSIGKDVYFESGIGGVVMHRMTGGCHCGNIRFEMVLPHAPETYNPRACDCDFCHKHGAAYVADPDGSLLIRLQDEHMVTRYRQGAGIADCLVCATCGVLVAIHYQDDQGEGRGFAVVNSRAVDGGMRFGESTPVSPKALTASEKVERWKRLWFQQVRILTSA